MAISVLNVARRLAPDSLLWRTDAYEFVSDRLAIDLLFGTDKIRRALEDGAEAQDIEALMAPDLALFTERRRPFLLYDASPEN